METETVKTEMPKEIHAIEYAGFWDFNADGFYGPSLLNIEDNKDAEQVANEIARRYNSHYELLQCLKNCLAVKPHKVSVEAMKDMIRATLEKANLLTK